MFTSIKSRLALVLSAAWVPASYLRLDEYWNAEDWLLPLLVGWCAIWAGVYALFWVFESSGFRRPSFPKIAIPHWAGYLLLALMLIVIMGLPKVLF